MQSVLVYGRLLARAIATGISNEVYNQPSFQWPVVDKKNYARCVHLVTASSGFSKTHTSAQVVNKYSFGDDACFIARHERGDVIGVADGVGGWRAYGIDPSQFPYSLMSTCERLVKEGRFLPVSPVEILGASYYELLESKAPLIGSCTACLLALHREDKTLYTANLGDSGFLVVREGEVVHRSEEQQHYFNTPFQLSVAPTVLEGTVISDSPESAQSTSFGVEEGDLILVGTDGLFDNMNEEMILHHLSKLRDPKIESVQMVANNMAKSALDLAFNPTYMSPFSLNAAANGFDITGGKPDDITVLLSRVTVGNPYDPT